MKQVIPITSKENFNKAAIKLVNCFLNMSDYEVNIIVGMLNYNIKSLNTITRAQLVNVLNLKPMSFNNYVKKLKDKGILLPHRKELYVSSSIIKIVEDGEINITIKLDNDQTN